MVFWGLQLLHVAVTYCAAALRTRPCMGCRRRLCTLISGCANVAARLAEACALVVASLQAPSMDGLGLLLPVGGTCCAATIVWQRYCFTLACGMLSPIVSWRCRSCWIARQARSWRTCGLTSPDTLSGLHRRATHTAWCRTACTQAQLRHNHGARRGSSGSLSRL